MTDVNTWPGRIAVGVVRSDPPQVFLAESDQILGRVLAVELVSRADPSELARKGVLDDVRQALLEERWADAVVGWIQATGEAVDAYPDEIVWTEERLDSEEASLEIRFSRVFTDPAGEAADN